MVEQWVLISVMFTGAFHPAQKMEAALTDIAVSFDSEQKCTAALEKMQAPIKQALKEGKLGKGATGYEVREGGFVYRCAQVM